MTHDLFVRPELSVDDVTVTYNNGHTTIHNACLTLIGGPIYARAGAKFRGKSFVLQSIIQAVCSTTRGVGPG
ncbi:iron ABC transporter permease, partial [Serratia ureilytica]